VNVGARNVRVRGPALKQLFGTVPRPPPSPPLGVPEARRQGRPPQKRLSGTRPRRGRHGRHRSSSRQSAPAGDHRLRPAADPRLTKQVEISGSRAPSIPEWRRECLRGSLRRTTATHSLAELARRLPQRSIQTNTLQRNQRRHRFGRELPASADVGAPLIRSSLARPDEVSLQTLPQRSYVKERKRIKQRFVPEFHSGL